MLKCFSSNRQEICSEQKSTSDLICFFQLENMRFYLFYFALSAPFVILIVLVQTAYFFFTVLIVLTIYFLEVLFFTDFLSRPESSGVGGHL